MIILDTNVVSELMKASPAQRVVAWMTRQSTMSLYTTSVTQAEVLHGIALLPAGKRQKAFEEAAKAMFERAFDGRILPFGSDAAYPYARIAAERRRAGRPIAQLDAQIAAIARAAGAAIATRDTADFEGCGLVVIEPWST